MIFGADNTRLWQLYEHFNDAYEVLSALLCKKIPNLFQREIDIISNFQIDYAKNILSFCEKNNIHILTFEDYSYPQCLKTIDCPPSVLFCVGDVDCLRFKKSLAVVGARRGCSYSLNLAEKISSEISEYGIPIISGFANGIDSASHSGAMNSHGKTVAVLGCGVMYDYPVGRGKFKEKISKNGIVISEYPPLAPPIPLQFKVRNRIISGLSNGVLVVEAGKKSGSLNTVSHALDQGREVFVIPPHDIFDERFLGQIELLRDGATEVYSARDIIINL